MTGILLVVAKIISKILLNSGKIPELPQLWYRIVTSMRKRIAAQDSPDCQQSTFNGTIFFNCF
jgi:hypothetical protein